MVGRERPQRSTPLLCQVATWGRGAAPCIFSLDPHSPQWLSLPFQLQAVLSSPTDAPGTVSPLPGPATAGGLSGVL